jgi:hypothetical protein
MMFRIAMMVTPVGRFACMSFVKGC